MKRSFFLFLILKHFYQVLKTINYFFLLILIFSFIPYSFGLVLIISLCTFLVICSMAEK